MSMLWCHNFTLLFVISLYIYNIDMVRDAVPIDILRPLSQHLIFHLQLLYSTHVICGSGSKSSRASCTTKTHTLLLLLSTTATNFLWLFQHLDSLQLWSRHRNVWNPFGNYQRPNAHLCSSPFSWLKRGK